MSASVDIRHSTFGISPTLSHNDVTHFATANTKYFEGFWFENVLSLLVDNTAR